MAFEPLKETDLPLINRLLQAHPDLHETIGLLKQVNQSAKYPINSFDDLAKALGGETFTFRGRTMTMAEAKEAIPAYYFPIGSESDLMTKMADLSTALPAPAHTTVKPTLESAIKLMAASAVKPPSVEAPKLIDEEVHKIAGLGSKRPGIGGVSRAQFTEEKVSK
jgi:hypothetical protein